MKKSDLMKLPSLGTMSLNSSTGLSKGGENLVEVTLKLVDGTDFIAFVKESNLNAYYKDFVAIQIAALKSSTN
jgi:hypothetical protein